MHVRHSHVSLRVCVCPVSYYAHVSNSLCQCACWAECSDTVPSATRPGVRKRTQEHTWLGSIRQHNTHPPKPAPIMEIQNYYVLGFISRVHNFCIVLKELTNTFVISIPCVFSISFTNNLHTQTPSWKMQRNCPSSKACEYVLFCSEIGLQYESHIKVNMQPSAPFQCIGIVNVNSLT